jgi:uncharacterized protein (DUF1501 family)
MLSRRFFLGAASVAAATLFMPRIAFARANTSRRFVFIIQRGAADGLSTLGPTGDPQHAALREDFDSDLRKGAKLGSFFTLHPSLAGMAKMYAGNEALFVHAVASPYRDRSHFDGQNVLETGSTGPYRLSNGWLNRMVALLPADESKALALSDTIPMALRGSNEVSSYAPSKLTGPSDDLLQRVSQLYGDDAQLHALWSDALATRKTAGDATSGRQNGAALGSLGARLLAADTGPRLMMIETENWDTHSGQRGRLGNELANLDAMLRELKAGLGLQWANTVVLVATEFGRTAHPNGTNGTDHGEGSLAMLLGGAVAGGKVIADWPGLSSASLYEGRDLRPTTALDSLIAAAVAQHYGLDPAHAMRTLFPQSDGTASAQKLIA